MALLITVAASPRHTPKHSMAAPAISSTACAAAFFPWLNSITLSDVLFPS